MKLLTSPPRVSSRRFPCSRCKATVLIKVITRIESEDDLEAFFFQFLNRAHCPGCGTWVQAQEKVTAKLELDGHAHLHLECIPIDLLEDPIVVEDLAKNIKIGVKTVFSHDELERSIGAHVLVEAHRKGQVEY